MLSKITSGMLPTMESKEQERIDLIKWAGRFAKRNGNSAQPHKNKSKYTRKDKYKKDRYNS